MICRALVASLVLVPVAQVAAQLPPLIPVEHFFDSPQVTWAQISPDGRWLAYLKPYRDKLNIFVRPAAGGQERRLTADTLRPIPEYYWSADGANVIYLQDKGGNENFHIFAVPVSAAPEQARDLTPYEGARALVADIPRDLPKRIFIALNKRDPSAFDAYWLDLDTGKLELAAQNPGRFSSFLADRAHQVHVAMAHGPAGEDEIHVRADSTQPWRRLVSYPVTEDLHPLRIHPDGRHLYMLSNHGETDLTRLVSLDLETGQERVVHEDPEHTAEPPEELGVLFGQTTDSVLWVAYDADTVRIYPQAPGIATDLARIRRLHDGTPVVTSMTRDEQRWVVQFDSPTDPRAISSRSTAT
jgi:dipeptidyl aminopeptidase/acylaminoacyl peptidase